jgi:hypothetical protein
MLILLWIGSASGQGPPATSTHCIVLAVAHSGFFFDSQKWSGLDPINRRGEALPRFQVEDPFAGYGPSEYIFSNLEGARPVIRHVYGGRAGKEAQAMVLDRTAGVVVMAWEWVPGGQWHLAAVNRTARRVTITSVESGPVGIAGSVAIGDCK